MRYILMTVTCVFVSAAMGVILTWFFRRLHRIEEERWGKKKDWASGVQATRKDKKKKKKEKEKEKEKEQNDDS